MPVQASIDGPARTHFEAGRTNYVTRQGQLNLSCAHCHERSWGRTLLAEPISQGQSNDFPAYRLEWQRLGSLHRRLRACQAGIRALQSAPGSQELLDLELYLAWRANGLPVEAPGCGARHRTRAGFSVDSRVTDRILRRVSNYVPLLVRACVYHLP